MGAYETIGLAIPGLLLYMDLFEKFPALSPVLEAVFGDILEFHCLAADYLTRSKGEKFFNAVWKTFDSKFNPILTSLKSHRELLESNKSSVTIDEIDKMRTDIQKIRESSEKQAQAIATERHEKMLKRVETQLQVPNYELDRQVILEETHSNSGRWVFDNPEFKKWADTGTTGHATIYVHGVPGGGKSTLITTVIGKMMEERVQWQSNGSHRPVLYFYCRYNQEDKRTFNGMLRGLFHQVLDQDHVVTDDLSDQISTVDPVTLRSSTWLANALENALLAFDYSFILIDGLDECHIGEAKKSLDWLLSLASGKTLKNGCSIRLICSGQRSGELFHRLSKNPSIPLDTSAHVKDIQRYCKDKLEGDFQERFELDQNETDDITDRVVHNAQGMFLFAKLVIENLLGQTRLYKLREELREGVFPKGLQRAYDRVFQSVFGDAHNAEKDDAKAIVKWIVGAKRLLRWREIQATFCIDEKEGNVEYRERRVRGSCKRLCGSFVDINIVSETADISHPETVIQLVHRSAQDQGVIQPDMEATNLARFSLRYLTTAPFDRSSTDDNIMRHAESGYYALQDYCVAHWFDHLKCSMPISGPATTTLSPEIAQLAQLAMGFLKFYCVPSKPMQYDINICSENAVDIVADLPEDSRQRNTLLDIEHRTRRIRRKLEQVSSSPDTPNVSGAFHNLYGVQNPFKCPKVWCERFASGFSNAQDRDAHLNSHELPFRCNSVSCFGFRIGFGHKDHLQRHLKYYHRETPDDDGDLFPSITSSSSTGGLQAAVRSGDADLVQRLLDEGADPNSKHGGNRVFHTACELGYVGICESFLSKGADVIKTLNSFSVAIAACHADIVQLLLDWRQKAVADLEDHRWLHGFPLLDAAAQSGHLNIFQLLIAHGSIDKIVGGALDDSMVADIVVSACRSGNQTLVEYILETLRVDIKPDSMRKNPFLVAARHGHREIVDLLLSSGNIDINQCHPISEAIDNSHLTLAKDLMIFAGSSLSKSHMKSILISACKGEHVSLLKEVICLENFEIDLPLLLSSFETGNLDIIETLLGHPSTREAQLGPGAFLGALTSEKLVAAMADTKNRCLAIFRRLYVDNPESIHQSKRHASEIVIMARAAFRSGDSQIINTVRNAIQMSNRDYLMLQPALENEEFESVAEILCHSFDEISGSWEDVFRKMDIIGVERLRSTVCAVTEFFALRGEGLRLLRQSKVQKCSHTGCSGRACSVFNCRTLSQLGSPPELIQKLDGSDLPARQVLLSDIAWMDAPSSLEPLIEWFLSSGFGNELLWACIIDERQAREGSCVPKRSSTARRIIGDTRINLDCTYGSLGPLAEGLTASLGPFEIPGVNLTPLRFVFEYESNFSGTMANPDKLDLTKLLLENERVSSKADILFEAVELGKFNLLGALLKFGSMDLNIQNSQGQTPLEKAAKFGNVGAVRNLLWTKKCSSVSVKAALHAAEIRGAGFGQTCHVLSTYLSSVDNLTDLPVDGMKCFDWDCHCNDYSRTHGEHTK